MSNQPIRNLKLRVRNFAGLLVDMVRRIAAVVSMTLVCRLHVRSVRARHSDDGSVQLDYLESTNFDLEECYEMIIRRVLSVRSFRNM